MTLVTEDEAEPIHSAIIRKEAWTLDAVRRLRAEADKRLREGPWSVTFDRPKVVELDPHEFYSEAPYYWPNPQDPAGPYVRNEGQMYPNRFIANKTALNAMCDAVLTLGTAAFLLDDSRYAARASRIIQTWFINPKTRMNPGLDFAQSIPGVNNGRGAGILDGRSFIRAIQGMEFLAQTGSWDAKEQAAVHRWFEEYLHWLTQSKNATEEKKGGGNHAAWWAAETAAVATFVQNRPAAQATFNYYRDHLFPRSRHADGGATREEARLQSLAASSFQVEAFSMVSRIGQVSGVNLWTARTKSGDTLATIIDYLEPYIADPRKPSKEPIADFANDNLYALAFAGMGMKRPEYVALYRKMERPEGSWIILVDLMVGRWEAAAHQTRH